MTNTPDAAVYEVLLTVVRSLVDQPEQVEIVSTPAEGGATFRVTVAPSDVGKVIGMNGRTARAIRTIISANAAKLRRNYSLDISGKNDPSDTGPRAT